MPQHSERHKTRALEALLVTQAQSGDRRAFERLVVLRGPRLAMHAQRLLGEREAARDVTQEAWVEITRSLGKLKAAEAFLPWALRIVSRRVAAEIKRRQRGRAVASQVAQTQVNTTPPRDGSASDAAKVRMALETLPMAQKAAMALFYLDELTVAEVAVALDIPMGTVKTRLMHARTKLRAQLGIETENDTGKHTKGDGDGKAGSTD